MPSQSLDHAVEWLNQRISDDTGINSALFARLRAEQLEKGLRHGPRPIGSFLRPLVLSRTTYDAVARAAETVAGAFERLAEHALRDETLLKQLEPTEREARLARIDPGYRRLCVSSRFDTYLSDEGFKFLEYNAESPAGIVDQTLLEDIFFGLPHMREFLARYALWRPRPHERLLVALVAAYHDWGGAEERPQIGIIDWKGVSTESEFYVLRDYFESEGYPTMIADPHDLAYDGEALTVGGFRIDVFYKRIIIHEFLEKFDDEHPLLLAYRDRKVCMANSFRPKLVHKKLGFAALSDPRYEHLFTPEQLNAIRRHIPWTRRVRDGATVFDGTEHDMMTLLRRERERLVLKPNDDYGGEGVRVGWATDEREWDEACAHALAQPYVVQQLAPVRKERMPTFTDRLEWQEMIIDFDPFLFLNEAEGGIVRLSSSSLSNVSSGGGVTSLLVLEDT